MKEYELKENDAKVVWNENLQPRKTEVAYFKDRVKFNIEFDIKEVSKMQQKIKTIDNIDATNKDLLRIAILSKFGLNNERVVSVAADTTEVIKDSKYYIDDVNALSMKAFKAGEVVTNERLQKYINAVVPKELQKEVLSKTLKTTATKKVKEVVF